MTRMAVTPSDLGYRMPAEWERHAGTWLSWPKDTDTFPGDVLRAVEVAYVKIVEALGRDEEVRILVNDEKAEARARAMIKGDPKVSFEKLSTVDVWMRDYAPIFVKGKDLALVKWAFNAWGNKYEDLLPDNEAGERLAASTGLKVFEPGAVLEGGSIDANGSGTVLTTEQCLLNPNRNPSMTRSGIERLVGEHLGASQVVWLRQGIEGDDTDGHVDDIARFVSPRRVAIAIEPDSSDPNHEALRDDLRILKEALDERGRPLEVVEIPMPPRVSTRDGRLPASHLNFYIGNGCVLVPTFGGSSDDVALKALEVEFPHREAVGVDCRALVYGLGTIHCVTQQIPDPGY